MEEARAARAVETVARAAYGRLVAYLATRSRDVAAAEDALGDAFQAALRTWPTQGVPDRPDAWLAVAARRRLGEAARHARVREAAATTLALLEAVEPAAPDDIPDERLKLLLACAHPAIDPAARAPLMLQAVLGLDAAAIASAFLTSPSAMGQRLVRAKARLRDAGVAFELPGREALPERLDAVLSAVYAAYGAGWEAVDGADVRRRNLTGEAIWLARLLSALAPDEPEAHGLLALMLHCEARQPARRDAAGAFVPLSKQDTALWSRELIADAERSLALAAAMGRVGRFQLEAAIQSLHAHGGATGRAPREELARLYEGLVRVAPTVGALVGRAAASAEAFGPERGLALLDAVARETGAYQPAWVLRAHLEGRLGRMDRAEEARRRAVGLTEDPAVRAFLLRPRS